MKLLFDGRTIPAKNLDSARIRDVMALQDETGWTLTELRTRIAGNETIGAAVVLFLSRRSAGEDVTWDDAIDRSPSEIVLVPDKGDLARADGADASDPARPEASGADAGKAQQARRSTRSSTANRGSKTKSAGG